MTLQEMASFELAPHVLFGMFSVMSAYLLTWGARWIAPRLDFVDRPDSRRKLHAHATPLLGGVAVLMATAGSMLLPICLLPSTALATRDSLAFSAGLALSGLLFCLLGLWDDRWPLRSRTKLIGQILASLPFLMLLGRSIHTISLLGLRIELGPFGPAFVVFWLVACVNIVNLLDGLDGLVGTIGLIASLAIMSLSFGAGNVVVGWWALLLAGSLLGFLLHNWPPARVFLGDAGSHTIGFLIGALSLNNSLKTTTGFTLVAPLAVMSIPAFDTAVAILRRKLNGKSLGEADRGHIHHRLRDRGLSPLSTLLTISGLCAATALSAVLGTYFDSDAVIASTTLTLLSFLAISRIFGYDEIKLVLHRLQLLWRFASNLSHRMTIRLLLVRLQSPSDAHHPELWDELLERFKRLGTERLDLTYSQHLDGQAISAFRWKNDATLGPDASQWQVEFRTSPDDEGCLLVSARGRTSANQCERLSDVFRLISAVCQNRRLLDNPTLRQSIGLVETEPERETTGPTITVDRSTWNARPTSMTEGQDDEIRRAA